jgi:hypothetical protein
VLLEKHHIHMEKRRKTFVFILGDRDTGKRLIVEHAVGDYTIQSNIVNNVRRLIKT